MTEQFILDIILEIGLLALGFFAVYYIGNYAGAKKFQEESKKLQLKLNQARDIVGNFSDKPQDAFSQMLSSVGVDGVMKELGIDPSILSNPLVKGLISKYAPRILEQLSKKGVTDEKKIGFL